MLRKSDLVSVQQTLLDAGRVQEALLGQYSTREGRVVMRKFHSLLIVLQLAVFLVRSESQVDSNVETTTAKNDRQADTYKDAYAIAGLPQQDFLLNQNYPDGEVIAIKFRGTRGYLIKPKGVIDSQRRWIWIAPLWVAFNSPTYGDSYVRYYVESALDAGFHVAGVDVGTTCGSPKGTELYQQFYEWIVNTYHLNPKVRLFGQSNGGLISYAWAFRHPQYVERIFGLYPVTDMRTWPKLEKVCGAERITPPGLAFPYMSVDELKEHLLQVNPIENLEPLAHAGVEIFHIHGDKDELVPMEDNSVKLVDRYRALGGVAKLEVLKGLAHGGTQFFHYQPAADFLTAK
jgi:hypothetical protein